MPRMMLRCGSLRARDGQRMLRKGLCSGAGILPLALLWVLCEPICGSSTCTCLRTCLLSVRRVVHVPCRVRVLVLPAAIVAMRD